MAKTITQEAGGTLYRLVKKARTDDEACEKCVAEQSGALCKSLGFACCDEEGCYWEDVAPKPSKPAKPPRCPFCHHRMGLIDYAKSTWVVGHRCCVIRDSLWLEYEGPLRKTRAGAISAAWRDLAKRFRRWLEKENT